MQTTKVQRFVNELNLSWLKTHHRLDDSPYLFISVIIIALI